MIFLDFCHNIKKALRFDTASNGGLLGLDEERIKPGGVDSGHGESLCNKSWLLELDGKAEVDEGVKEACEQSVEHG